MADRRVERTRAALGEAVIALAGEKPFADVTIAEIADRAEIGYATFFRHYRDKESLLVEIAASLIDELLALMMPALIDDDTLAAAIALCRFVDERRPICRALLAGGAETNIRQLSVERAFAFTEAHDFPIAANAPKDLIIAHAVSATLGLLAGWLDSDSPMPPEEMGGLLNHLVLRPVRSG